MVLSLRARPHAGSYQTAEGALAQGHFSSEFSIQAQFILLFNEDIVNLLDPAKDSFAKVGSIGLTRFKHKPLTCLIQLNRLLTSKTQTQFKLLLRRPHKELVGVKRLRYVYTCNKVCFSEMCHFYRS